MRLYRIYTRQERPEDKQYYSAYCVWADTESAAQVLFNRRCKHAVIKSIYPVRDEPLLLLEAGI